MFKNSIQAQVGTKINNCKVASTSMTYVRQLFHVTQKKMLCISFLSPSLSSLDVKARNLNRWLSSGSIAAKMTVGYGLLCSYLFYVEP
jgi:hypothetical protein